MSRPRISASGSAGSVADLITQVLQIHAGKRMNPQPTVTIVFEQGTAHQEQLDLRIRLRNDALLLGLLACQFSQLFCNGLGSFGSPLLSGGKAI